MPTALGLQVFPMFTAPKGHAWLGPNTPRAAGGNGRSQERMNRRMRGYFVTLFSMAMVVPSTLSARSEETPTLDVRQVCRGIASQSADPLATGLMKDNVEECLKSEQGVREQIKEKWSTFSARDKQHCVTLAKTGGESSYTELLTCLEMSRDVRALRSAATSPSGTDTAKQSASSPSKPMPQPAAAEKAPPSPGGQDLLDKRQPAPTGQSSQSNPALEQAVTEIVQIKKEVEKAKSEAQAAKASEALVQRKLADADAALKRAKEEAGRATAQAEGAKAEAKAAWDARAALERKLTDAEAARVAAEGREQACHSEAKSKSGFGARWRSWFGNKQPDAKSP
jgi:hypothetical protein